MGRSAIVIRRAVAAGRHRLPFLFGLAALIFIPLGLLYAVEGGLADINSTSEGERALLASIAAVSTQLVFSMLGGILYAGAVAIAVVGTPPGENPSLRRVVADARWLALIAIDILFALGLLVSLLLLVVPAFFFFARYALCAVLAEIEELGIRESFRRSAELSRGARRLVLGLLFSAIVLSDIATALIQAALGGLGANGFLTTWVTSAAGEVLLNPIAALLAVALALELGSRPIYGPATAAGPVVDLES